MTAIMDDPNRLIRADATYPMQHLRVIERSIAAVLLAVAEGFITWRLHRRTLYELGKLDDWMLRDIGLSRADLPNAVGAADLRGIAQLLTSAQFERRKRSS